MKSFIIAPAVVLVSTAELATEVAGGGMAGAAIAALADADPNQADMRFDNRRPSDGRDAHGGGDLG
jgi:hypothetical protein